MRQNGCRKQKRKIDTIPIIFLYVFVRPIPLPPDHEIDRADIKKASRLLAETDRDNILCQRHDSLARVFGFVRSLRLNLSDVLLIECGAHQYGPPAEDDWEYNSAISHFLALHGRELGIDYRAFDPGYSPEALEREFADGLAQPPPHVPPLFARRPDLVPVIAQRVKAVSLPTYGHVVSAVNEAGKPAVLFSNHVLNDPDRTDDYPFWQLPGLHHHSGSLIEMADILSSDDEEAAPMPHASARLAELIVRGIAGNGATHLAAFKRIFGVSADVRRAFGRDMLIRYWWSA